MFAFDKFDVFEDQCIGSGGEARVFRGEWAQIDVAVRRIFLGPVSQVERDRRFLQFKSEVRLMKQLVHPSIASFFGCSLHRSHFYMILELGSCSMRDAVVYHQQHGRGSSLAERLSGSLLDFSGGAGGARSDDGDAAPSPSPASPATRCSPLRCEKIPREAPSRSVERSSMFSGFKSRCAIDFFSWRYLRGGRWQGGI